MGLVKRTYVDGETIITAQNLNDIQDEIIQNASDISEKGTYSKPVGGIPKSDLALSVQDSLDDADSAYQKPSGGIPDTDLSSAVQTILGKADSAYQKPSGGIPKSDLTSSVQDSLDDADSAYQKPSTGIPSTDMATDVQTSLGKADTAYQKPSGGIPESDLATAVQASLDAADTAYQKPNAGIPKTDLASAVQDTLDTVADLEDEVIISDTQPTEENNKLWVKESSSADGISIPTMGDIDDIEDEISVVENTLNSVEDAITTHSFTAGTLSDIQTAMVAFNATLQDFETRPIEFETTSAATVLENTTHYAGDFTRYSSTRFIVEVNAGYDGRSFVGRYNNGTWEWWNILRESTFTPIVSFKAGSTAVTPTISYSVGKRTGNIVYVYFEGTFPNNVTGAGVFFDITNMQIPLLCSLTGVIFINGTPYTPYHITATSHSVYVRTLNGANVQGPDLSGKSFSLSLIYNV